MDWTWITGLNWNLIRDVTVPIASILIPSVIAIWLARSERKAARADRQAETLSKGIEEAFAAMADLTEAAYTDDIRENAKIRLRAASRIERIEHGLGRDNEVVWDWMSEELGIVAQGLEERNDGLARGQLLHDRLELEERKGAQRLVHVCGSSRFG
jgi:hypothetical protein